MCSDKSLISPERYLKIEVGESERWIKQNKNLKGDELDFIINYDIKYRMGRDSEAE